MDVNHYIPMDYSIDEYGCEEGIPKPREVPYIKRFRNEDDFIEWSIRDHYGNTVNCYYNGYYEIHVKQPWCYLCDDMMVPVGDFVEKDTFRWVCPHCGKTYSRDDVEYYDLTWSRGYKHNYRNDYGIFPSENTVHICGSKELYNEIYNKNWLWPDDREKGFLPPPPFDFTLKLNPYKRK